MAKLATTKEIITAKNQLQIITLTRQTANWWVKSPKLNVQQA